MKALVLCAGFGNRLRPFTAHTPKSLFPLGGRPLLFHWIDRLAAAGCEAVAVNTHHLGDRIAAAVAGARFPIPVRVRHEPVRLGTGGAIRNWADFWDDRPFLVVNADVWTNLDPAALRAFHLTHDAPATLALWDEPAVNTVGVDAAGRVTGFDAAAAADVRLTFTGVQALDPEILDWIPEGAPVSSIDAFRRLIRNGRPPRAWRPAAGFWRDLGTPERYRAAALDRLAAEVFGDPPEAPRPRFAAIPIPGDASDRAWFRLRRGDRTAVLADHGIRAAAEGPSEADAFVDIGRHLAERDVAVPRILAAERFAGLVAVEDLGSVHLQDAARRSGRPAAVEALYRAVIDAATDLWVRGPQGFDPRWCYQTPRYDRSVVMAEGAYFVEGFLKAVCGRDVTPADFAEEFARLADRIAETGTEGFLHRDLQSRNILIRPGGRPAFIDFQGGRIGPIQYDLASLEIDPYAGLSAELRRRLREGAARRLAPRLGISPARFLRGCAPCALARNLQILGAFGTLSRVRGKPQFAAHIPAALATLRETLASGAAGDYPRLAAVVSEAAP
jgi:aminoglycoside/choline kinase family phosphotransferase/dTDP-glucose pyrophosphorylase